MARRQAAGIRKRRDDTYTEAVIDVLRHSSAMMISEPLLRGRDGEQVKFTLLASLIFAFKPFLTKSRKSFALDQSQEDGFCPRDMELSLND